MPHTARIPVALVDDHTLVRGMLADMINGTDGYVVVLEAGNGQEFIEGLAAVPHIAVAIVDLHMPIMDGYETIAWIRAHAPRTRALALTFEKTEVAMVRAIRAGACGFVLKDARRNVFLQALQQVATVGHYYDAELAQVLGTTSQADRNEGLTHRSLEDLSDREAEFLGLVCHDKEYTYDQIAELMRVHRRTVDGYRESIFRKYGIKSKVGLVLFAIKRGVVQV